MVRTMFTLVSMIASSAVFAAEPAAPAADANVPVAAPSSATIAAETTETLADAESLWMQRVDGAKLEQALAAYETKLTTNPNDRHALERLVRGWYFYGDAFSDDQTIKLERWAKAIDFGNRCLNLNAGFAGKVKGGEKEKDAASALVKDDVVCAYWTSTALGKWAKAQGLTTTLKYIPSVKAYMTRVDELEPSFFHYGPARYWGAYYAALPSFAGKDLEKSKTYLAASIEGAPNYLGTRVIRAEFLATQTRDLALFDAELKYVLEADPNALPEVAAENAKEQEKARKLQAKRADLFVEAEGK
jgi:hypothetical protein